MRRSPALLVLLLLAGCGRDGPDDAAIAVAGTGIPVGAIGASGVGFDAPSGAARPTPVGKSKPGTKKPRPLPEPLPADPFADPPGGAELTPDGGPPARPRHPPHEPPHE